MKTTGKGIDDRMKEYEGASDFRLTTRLPLIIRVDGKCFHTLLRGADKPFDQKVIKAMADTAAELCRQIAGTRLAYTQSDEISLVVRDDNTIATQPWMDRRIQKMCSISASIAAVAFTGMYGKPALFDSRCFILPEHEVINYLIWRQQDATRNAIQMAGQSMFSHKQLHGVSCDQIQEKMFKEKGVNFNNYQTYEKRGTVIRKEEYKLFVPDESTRTRWVMDQHIPVFTKDRAYIDKLVAKAEEE